jgi:SRSO17 transposase
MIPEAFVGVLAAYGGCFQARSYATFQWLVLGWVQCLERRTRTAAALASGAVGTRHFAVFHRFFARAQWSLDAVGRVVFEQAVRWLPAEQPLYLLGDDTLARKQGTCVSLAAMHHAPLLSTAQKPFCSFGHVWVVLAL